MKFKQLMVLFIAVFVVASSSLYVFAYDAGTTHRKINFHATVHCSNLDTILKGRLGLEEGIREVVNEKSIWKWVEDGGEKEDDGFSDDLTITRYANHFHDPMNPWADAGLKNDSGLVSFPSSLVWGLNSGEAQEYSWPMARLYYYNALLFGSEDDFAKTFRSLGQLMHLVSDASVPAHVRNDGQPGDFSGKYYKNRQKDLYEKWVEKHYSDGKVKYWVSEYFEDVEAKYEFYKVGPNIFNNANLSQFTEAWNNPISALWDQDIYYGNNPSETWANDLGLSEFTNANFLSQDTFFSGDYLFPDIIEAADETVSMEVVAEDGLFEEVLYVLHPDKGYRLATVTYFNSYIPYRNFSFGKDDNVWQDYADRLVPRSVGYSAALLDYFFRGDFDVSDVSYAKNGNGAMTSVDMLLKNASKLSEESTEIEAFGDGTITISCRYLPPGEDEYEYSLIENAYTIYSDGDSINEEYVAIGGDFEDPVPAGAKDISLAAVFQGKMGNESDAVAARVLTTTSRIAYYSQPGGLGNTSNIYTIESDGTDERQITDAVEPDPYYFAPEWSPDGRMLAFNRETCTDPDPDPDGLCRSDLLIREIWVTDINSQESFPDNVVSILNSENTDWYSPSYPPDLQLFSFSPDGSKIVAIANDDNLHSGLVIFDVYGGTGRYINGPDFWMHIPIWGSAPAWSPKNDYIAYYARNKPRENPGNIFLIDPEGGEAVQLTYGEDINIQPAWSLDGERILFVSDRDGGDMLDIWIMDRDGTNMQKILDCDDHCFSPSFSPDGQQIIFQQSGGLYKANIDGSGRTLVISSSNVAPSWSPVIFEAMEPDDDDEEPIQSDPEEEIERIYIVDGETISAVMPGDTITLDAIRTPADMEIVWSGEAMDSEVDVDLSQNTDDSCRLNVAADSGNGWYRVRAESVMASSIYKEALVYIGCRSCAAGGGNYCALVPAGGVIQLGSVDVQISLGKTDGGQSAGSLMLKHDTASPELATPAALSFSSLAKGAEERYDEDGNLRQVLAPGALADIVILDDYAYEIRFYNQDEVLGLQDDLYVVADTASPFSVWTISNPDASDTVYNRLEVTEDRGSTPVTAIYTWDESTNTWTLSKADGLRQEARFEEVVGSDRIVTETVSDDTGEVASVTTTTYHTYAWGEEIVEVVTDPDGDALTTTTSYYTDESDTGSYTRRKAIVNSDGSWTRYEYNEQGRVAAEISSFLDASSFAPADEARAVYYDYDPVDALDSEPPEDTYRPRTVTEIILGQVTSKTYYVYSVDDDDIRTEITETCATPGAAYGAAGNQRTVRVVNPAGTGLADSGRVASVAYPDGRMDIYEYTLGSYTTDGSPDTPGIFTPDDGLYRQETVLHTATSSPDGIAYKSTRDVTISDAQGNTLVQATEVYTGSGFERISYTVNHYDAFGRIEDVYGSDGSHRSSMWDCCGKISETDASGITTSFEYDGLKRVEQSTREGAFADTWPGQEDVVTTFLYDGAGRTLSRTIASGFLTLHSETEYDLAGRTETVVDTSGLVTGYSFSADGRTTMVTRPGGITEITEHYLDGRIKSVTGSGVIPRYYTYGVNADGSQWTEVRTGSESGFMWEVTITDVLGRTIHVEKPGAFGIETSENFYDDQGRLVRTTVTGQADTLYAYDELGNQVRAGLDVDMSGDLAPASEDRITDTDTSYVEIEGDWWQETEQFVYGTENDAAATSTGIQRTQLTGLPGSVAGRSVSIDIHGNETVSEVAVDRVNKLETRTIDYPDSDIDAVAVTKNGLAVSNQSKTGIVTTFTYDALGRQVGVMDPRIGTSETHYDDQGRVEWVEDAADNRTEFSYDSVTGRKILETNALGKTTRYAYNDRGQVTRTWGDATYPVKYTYDAYGRMEEMHTYRTDAEFTGDVFPEGVAGDITTWHYDEATGLLSSKEYADGNEVVYSYTTGGKLETRTWARTDGGGALVTTYAYDPNTGELTGIEYSDATPEITFVYDRLGRQTIISDAVGSRTFAYNDALQLESETITGLYDKTLTRTYETSGMVGRNSGFTLGAGYTVSYDYDTTGRFDSLAFDVSGDTGTATYAYVPDSDLIETLSTDSGQITTNTYEPNRNLKTTVENAFNTAVISRYGYQYDELGRRAAVTNSGSAFSESAFNRFEYNDRNELTGSGRYIGTDTMDVSQPVNPESRLYDYDPIGNRESATEGVETYTYAPNDLNQYDSITDGGGTQALYYDADGNLTEKDGFIYEYNGENRLILVEPVTPGDGDTMVEFAYDYMGRRVQKIVYTYVTDSWLLTSDVLFVYDGWNLIEELDDTQTIQKHYIWGLDLSQTLQGAGGVGGLLAVVDDFVVYLYSYDGNGNVGQVIDAADGSVDAHYEYDPYGNDIISGGGYADQNSFRFSTKFFDSETELYYYGYRYYSAELGRWLSRDSIGEKGGFNLYEFVNNNPKLYLDYLGHEVLGVVVHQLDGPLRTYIAVEGDVVGYITKEQYYLVPSESSKGYNMVLVDYHVVSVRDRSRIMLLSDLIFKNKGSFFNTEKKEMLRRSLSFVLSFGGPLAKLSEADKAADVLTSLDRFNTFIGTVQKSTDAVSDHKIEWGEIGSIALEASEVIPFWSILKNGYDLATYESQSIKPFEGILHNGFKRAKMSDVIDLTCKIKQDGMTRKKISEAIVKHHGF